MNDVMLKQEPFTFGYVVDAFDPSTTEGDHLDRCAIISGQLVFAAPCAGCGEVLTTARPVAETACTSCIGTVVRAIVLAMLRGWSWCPHRWSVPYPAGEHVCMSCGEWA